MFGYLSQARHDDAVAAPIQADAARLQDRAQTYATVANVALAVGGVAAIVTLIVFAQQATAGRVVDDYYRRASRYDTEIATANASRALGWSATLTLTTNF